jgi:hypothetical protein
VIVSCLSGKDIAGSDLLPEVYPQKEVKKSLTEGEAKKELDELKEKLKVE